MWRFFSPVSCAGFIVPCVSWTVWEKLAAESAQVGAWNWAFPTAVVRNPRRKLAVCRVEITHTLAGKMKWSSQPAYRRHTLLLRADNFQRSLALILTLYIFRQRINNTEKALSPSYKAFKSCVNIQYLRRERERSVSIFRTPPLSEKLCLFFVSLFASPLSLRTAPKWKTPVNKCHASAHSV